MPHAVSLDGCLRGLMASGKGMLQPLATVTPARSGIGPAARLRQDVAELLQQQVLSPSVTDHLAVAHVAVLFLHDSVCCSS